MSGACFVVPLGLVNTFLFSYYIFIAIYMDIYGTWWGVLWHLLLSLEVGVLSQDHYSLKVAGVADVLVILKLRTFAVA